ncbi:uncharacterized protein LOC132260164 [Phlebotomus argentipes]|uniref:uncharacterized protein LOC132260164 n=1 Tax=Phlebotomus argentipes TaxID=94469 RepID=UPI0028937077|nr:uncharacterized protein LOC132260164 [Phlebotomus argentipes]
MCEKVIPCGLEHLRNVLQMETERRDAARIRCADLGRQMESFEAMAEMGRRQPTSCMDAAVDKQAATNNALAAQVATTRDQLDALSRSFRNIEVCSKECDLNMRDLIVDYACITKAELLKEVKRFERMQIDLKSNIDRLQFRLDCESKQYYSLLDQFQKLQIELYYLQNLGDKYSFRSFFVH